MDEQLTTVIEAITVNLSSSGHRPYRAVNDTAATEAVCRSLEIEEGEAWQLCQVAVEQHLDGYTESSVKTGGLRAGLPPRRTVHEVWWVNTAAVAAAA